MAIWLQLAPKTHRNWRCAGIGPAALKLLRYDFEESACPLERMHESAELACTGYIWMEARDSTTGLDLGAGQGSEVTGSLLRGFPPWAGAPSVVPASFGGVPMVDAARGGYN